jgi:hypothetical protein
MIDFETASTVANYETWLNYWKQCRVTSMWHKRPDFTAENNPVVIRWREIPEDEDITKPHPDIAVQQMLTPLETFCFKAVRESLPDEHMCKTIEGLQKATVDYHDSMMQREKDFEEYLEYKRNGNLKVEIINETQPISWKSIRSASTEELFQTKLEIFESPPVQESENKEYRSKIRKATSIIEAMYWYYLIVEAASPDVKATVSEEKVPENIDSLLDNLPSEAIFKWKLQLFEKEGVQNSENKEARSKIRKANNLVELISAYAEIV